MIQVAAMYALLEFNQSKWFSWMTASIFSLPPSFVVGLQLTLVSFATNRFEFTTLPCRICSGTSNIECTLSMPVCNINMPVPMNILSHS